MNKRLKSLQSEISINAPYFKDDTTAIVNRVNRALCTDPEERTIYMRQKFIKMAFVAAVVMAFGATTVFAAVNINSGFLRVFFSGDTSYLDEFVQTPMQSTTDGRFVLTVEQTLITENQALIVYSVEALTDDALSKLNATNEQGISNFMGIDTISFGPIREMHEGGRLHFGGWSVARLEERNTETKHYFAITVTDITNEDGVDFFIRLNKMTDPQNIVISMQTNIAAHEIVLNCASGDDAILRITPVGIILERTIRTDGDILANMKDGLFFRRSNGEINTFSQLLTGHSMSLISETRSDSGWLRYEKSALFREIMSISEFASIILDGLEHDINDTSITQPFVLDQTLQQFELQPYYRGHLWVPLEELLERIGAVLYWDNETATVEYRNSTFEVTIGSTVVVRNGEAFDFYDEFVCEAAFISEDGRIIAQSRLLDLMGINIIPIATDDDWNFLPVSEWAWTVIP